MVSNDGSILSILLTKRIRELGFPSLRSFHEANRDSIGVSYELLRQVVRGGKIPRIESLLPILSAAGISRPVVRNLLDRLYPSLAPRRLEGKPAPPEPLARNAGIDEALGTSPWEVVERLASALARIPAKGNEDLWSMALHLAEISERKVRNRERETPDQPLLFGREPEAVYQFLVRRGRVPAFMSRGADAEYRFQEGIDYPDRYRGALLGLTIGAAFGRLAHGLAGEEVLGLFGGPLGIEDACRSAKIEPDPRIEELAKLLAAGGPIDPASVARTLCVPNDSGFESEGDLRYTANLRDRGFPWFEAGEGVSELSPSVRAVPVALRDAGDFRKLKLETGILAAITHPDPASVAGAILSATAVARALHTPIGSLDPILFARSVASAASGIDSDRSPQRPRGARSLPRRVGTDLPALLLRRASVEDTARSLGNGPAPSEGLPFALACVLSHPFSFRDAVLAAALSGGDSARIAALAGAVSGALLGASAVPPEWTGRVREPDRIDRAAFALLERARDRS